MTLDEARKRLFDTTFLLGGLRRRAAIKALAASPGEAGVLALVAALGQNHPSPQEILHALVRLSPEAEADKVEALWTALVSDPKPALAGVLARLGWPPARVVPAKTARDVLSVAVEGTAPEVLQAVAAFARALPVEGEAGNDAIFAAWVRSQSEAIGKLIAEQGRRPGTGGVLALAQALGTSAHPQAGAHAKVLRSLSPSREGGEIEALWQAFAKAPNPALADILVTVGWPPGRVVEPKTARDVLSVAAEGTAPEVLQAVAVFARALPVGDEAGNDAIYAAWVRSQTPDLERLIAEQGRQSAAPAFEALHALVTGRLDRYGALKDQDGSLLVQAFAMAPEPFRARLAQAVAASPDRGVKDAYRRALASGGVDRAQGVESLKRVGDQDGLFEQVRSLTLLEALGLCEHWAVESARPAHPAHRAAVDRAVAAYRGLGQFQVEPGPKLPDGMVDIFEHWRAEQPNDADLRADLDADEPFRKARGLYLGHERGLVDAKRLADGAKSDHWPERLIARLVDPALLTGAKEDHVLWVNACAGDASLLQAPIGGSPEDYARHSTALKQARGAAAGRTQALLTVLCTFQGVFVAGGITLDETGEATDRRAVELEEAGDVQF